LLSDLFQTSLCEGTLAAILAECHQTLQPVEAAIKEAIGKAEVAHFDESGMRIEGKLHWLHSSSTAHLTFYAHHPKRGHTATENIGILPVFSGTSVHDAWSSYFHYACSHSLCNAHLLRELTSVWEQTKQSWSRRFIALLLGIKRAVDKAKHDGADQLPTERWQTYQARYQRLLKQGLALSPPPEPTGKRGRPKQSAAKNLLDRLDRHREAVLAFAYDFEVPFDNNLAERDLRMLKVRQKISGCFRTKEGATQFCRIRGYISTLRKQGMDVLQALQSVFARQPYYPLLYA
jgi:transposase